MIATEAYILYFDDKNVPDAVFDAVLEAIKSITGSEIKYEYHSTLRGLAFQIPADSIDLIAGLNSTEFPFFIERDQVVSIANGDYTIGEVPVETGILRTGPVTGDEIAEMIGALPIDSAVPNVSALPIATAIV